MWFFNRKNKETPSLEFFAPVDGKLIGLEEVKDEAFRDKMLGDGFAFEPSDGEFVAPISGTLITVFPTKHAYGIKNDSGVEILLHIGLDTIELKGEGFTSHVEQNQTIKKGDRLVTVDLEGIKTKVSSLQTPLVITNAENRQLEIVKKGKVKKGDLVAILK